MKLFAKQAVLPGGRLASNVLVTLDCASGLISAVDASGLREAHEADVCLAVLTPGFVDIHTHGAGIAPAPECDAARAWELASENAVELARGGTTSLLATLTFDSAAPERARDAARAIGAYRRQAAWAGATVHGIHAEGPVVATLGGLPSSAADISASDLLALFESFAGLGAPVLACTISPSLERSTGGARIRALAGAGILPCLGHDRDASWDDCMRAVRAAAPVRCHLTHAFNVMSWHHRSPSLGNLALLSRFPPGATYGGLAVPTVELVSDAVHVHPAVALSLLAARGTADVAVISDSVMVAGGVAGACGCYCGRPICVAPVLTASASAAAADDDEERAGDAAPAGEAASSAVVLCGTSTIAGSCARAIDLLNNLTAAMGVPLGDAVMTLSETPARIARIAGVGAIEVGYAASVLGLTCQAGEAGSGPARYELAAVFVCGRRVV